MDNYWVIDERMREVTSRHLSENWLEYGEYEELISFLSNYHIPGATMINAIDNMYPEHKFRWDHMT